MVPVPNQRHTIRRFTLRLPESLHRQLREEAEQEGISLNQYIVYTLTRQVSSPYQVRAVSEQGVADQRVAYAELLAQLGTATHAEIQAVLAERDRVDPEEGLSPDVVQRLRERIAAKHLSE